MAHIIPGPDDVPQDYSKFTFDSWRDLDNYYSFWITRWKRTLDFLRSQHWRSLQELDEKDLPDWKRYPVINFTLAIYMDYLSDFLKSEVRFTATPPSPDPKDISSAELVEQLSKFLWDKIGMDSKRIQLASWLLSCGVGYLRVYWNTNTGSMIPLGLPTPDGSIVAIDPETGMPMPGLPPIMVDKGEIDIEVVPPQFVRWSTVPAHGVMVGLLLSKEETASLFGEAQAEQLTYTSTHTDFASELNLIQTPATVPTRDERALVIQHYIPRSSIYPDGLWWTAANDGRALLNGPYPLPAAGIPVVSFVWTPVPGDPNMGISPLYDITFSNKLYDEIMARVMEWLNKMKPKILLKSGGGLTYGDLNEEPFQELVTHPGGEPEFMETKQVPSTFYQTLADTKQDILALAGYSLGNQKGQQQQGAADPLRRWRTPPKQVEYGPTSVAIMNSNASWSKIGQLIAGYAATFYTEPRVVAVQGSDKMYQWKEFVGSVDLKNIAATVKADEITLFPWHRQTLRDTVSAVLDTQFGQILFMNPDGTPNMDRIEAAMEATGIDVSIPALDPDVVEARNEHVGFQSGTQVVPPMFWQNHQIHLDQHERVLKSVDFKTWNPNAQQAFVQHVQETAQLMNEAAQQESQAMIEQEKALRMVREQAELQADVRREMFSIVADAMKEVLKDVFGDSVRSLAPGEAKDEE